MNQDILERMAHQAPGEPVSPQTVQMLMPAVREMLLLVCKHLEIQPEQIMDAAFRTDPMTDQEGISLVVDYGVKGGKTHFVTAQEVECLEEDEGLDIEEPQGEEEPQDEDDYPPVPVAVPVPVVEPESEAVANFAQIPGVSAGLEQNLWDQGIYTFPDLAAALDSGVLKNVPGVGPATVKKITAWLDEQGV